MMDDALRAYDQGRSDGAARFSDPARAADTETGADYLVGVNDGGLAAFESDLIAAVRRALGEKSGDSGNEGR